MTVKPNKRVANSLMAYILTVICLLIPIMVVLGFILNKVDRFVAIGIIVVSMGYLLICKLFFSWYLSYTIKENGDNLVVEQMGILDMMGSSKDVYTIKSISKIKVRGTSVKVFGDITVKEPTRKLKVIKSMVLEDVTDEVLNLLKQKEEK